jgi:hypothetical protein
MPGQTLRACVITLAALLVLALPALADAPTNNPLVPAYHKIVSLIDAGKFDQAKSAALTMVAAARPGDVEQAGTIRAIVDSLRSHGQQAAADEILASAQKKLKPSGQVEVALAGGRADAATIARLRTFFRPMKTRGVFNVAVDLKRIRIGHQASILKIMDPTNTTEVFYKGLDGVLWAPINDEHRAKIFQALGIAPDALDSTVATLIQAYPRLGAQREQAIALLGAIGSAPGNQLTDNTRRRLLAFLVSRMNGEKDHALRRQSVLALALLSAIDMSTINAVVNYYATNTNVWETFPVQQFFEYHSARLHKLSNLADIRARVAGVNCFYTENILKFL